MRLKIKQNESTISEFQFGKGPIYIGRHRNSQIFLQHRAVSRQHAVIFSTQDGKWVIEDLDSANKTYLNGEAIHKAEIKTGDVLRIVDFSVEVDLERGLDADKPVELEDTLAKTVYDLEAAPTTAGQESIIREPEAAQAPGMRMPAKRLTDFAKAAEAISKAKDTDALLLTLLNVAIEQFGGHHSWCALRTRAKGPMTAHAGKHREGGAVELSEIKLNEKITEAVEKGHYLVMPRVPSEVEEAQKIRSAMIAPIMGPAGCFGVIYVDNSPDQGHYGLSDLDYLMLITIHTAAVLEKLA